MHGNSVTLVRDGFVRIPGRPRWRKAFDFVDKEDEAVVRRFLVQMIGYFGRLVDEERGK